MSELIRIERPRRNVAALFLNRPERRNALNMPLRLALAKAITETSSDPEVRCLVLAGDDIAFAAGADLTEIQAVLASADPEADLQCFRVAAIALAACPKPVIAAVRGFALGGGCELALACDLVVAGESARFGQAEVKLGLIPGAGGIQRLLRFAGRQAAMRLLITGDVIAAPEALALGLVGEVVPDDAVLEHAFSLAERVAAAAPLAVAAVKRRLNQGAEEPLSVAMAGDRAAFRALLATRDAAEGIEAFFARRPPNFDGR